MYGAIDFIGAPINDVCELFLPAPGSVRWFSNDRHLAPSDIWYHFQSQPWPHEYALYVIFMVLVTTPTALIQFMIALAGGYAARYFFPSAPFGNE